MEKAVFMENYILEVLRNAVREHKKIYIYGSGQMGKIVAKKLKKEGIDYTAFVVDGIYISEDKKIDGKLILPVEEILLNAEIKEKPVVIIAFRDPDSRRIHELEQFAEIINEDALSLWSLNEKEDLWTAEYFKKNRELLLKTYNMLADDKSRESMQAFLCQKLSGRFLYLKDVWEPNQYYDSQIVDFSKIQTFVDCGAYDGDSFLMFVRNYEKNIGKRYMGSSYLLEPDESNYQKMIKNCCEYENIRFFQLGAWNEKSTLFFQSDGTLSGILEDGDARLEVDTIDHLTKEKADFIKMDIEGSELRALQGAQHTIKKNHPVLAICVYHKCDDLWKIPEYIKNIDESYRFYIRAHSNYSMELVLYAI